MGPRFEDSQEGRFFRKYLEIATQIRGPFSTSLWESLIPQSSEAEPYIRHALVAIGAISKSLKDTRLDGAGSQNLRLCDNPNYIYALKKYDKALRGMRDAISEGKGDVRNTLFACLLIFCFENMVGKPGAAGANAISGLMVIYQWLLTTADIKNAMPIKKQIREYCLDEDIVTALTGLDLHVAFFIDKRPNSVHQIYIACYNSVISRIPEELPSLKIARHYFSCIMSRNYHFIRTVLDAAQAADPSKPGDYEGDVPFGEANNLSPGANIFFTLNDLPIDKYPDVLPYRESVRRWKRASTTVFDRAWKSGTQQEKTVVCLLQIHEIMTHIMLEGAFFMTQTAYDQFLPEYQRIMDLVEYVYPHLVDANDGEPLYRFDLGIIIAMFLVGVRCREKGTRDRAVQMMNRNKEYREGMWDTGGAGTILSWLRDVEDEMRDENGEIAEENRVSVTKAHLDLPNRRGMIGISRSSKQGLVFREEAIYW